MYITAGVSEEEHGYVCGKTRGTRKLEDASPEATAWPLAEAAFEENHAAWAMAGQEAKPKAETMRYLEAEVAKKRADARERHPRCKRRPLGQREMLMQRQRKLLRGPGKRRQGPSVRRRVVLRPKLRPKPRQKMHAVNKRRPLMQR